MSECHKRSLTILFVTLMVLAAMSLTGCGGADDEAATGGTGSTDPAAADTQATTSEGTEATTEASGTASAGGALTGEEQDDAVDIAQAYLVAKTDYTSDQFDWKLEAAARDNDGGWWVRVSATPKDDTAADITQVYVTRPAGFELWVAHGMSPEIDPATDENIPEEVRDLL
jgi:hypothetical protein